jgi:hypothetical protein
MPPVEFEPTISSGERRQNQALDRAVAGTGSQLSYFFESLRLASVLSVVMGLDIGLRLPVVGNKTSRLTKAQI